MGATKPGRWDRWNDRILWVLGEPCRRDIFTGTQKTMSLVGRCKEQEIVDGPRGLSLRVPSWGGGEDLRR